MADYACTITTDGPKPERISRNYHALIGVADLTNYNAIGEEITDITKYFSSGLRVLCDPVSSNGYNVYWDAADECFHAVYGSGVGAHTHVITLDTGVSAAEAAHTHAVALDGGATAAGAAHAHAVGSIAAAGAASGAGSSHNHVFTGTAITPVNVDIDDNDAAAADGVAIYLHTNDGTIGWLEFVSPTNADGIARLNSTGPYVMVKDSDAAATDGVAVYIDEDETAGSRLMAVTPLATAVYIPCSNGQYIKVNYSADPSTPGVQIYLDEDVANTHDRLMFVSPTDADATEPTDSTYHALAPVAAGANAAEDAHTHAAGTITMSGSVAEESTHTHGSGTLADAASGVGSSHTHGPGNLADAASGSGSGTGAAMTEISDDVDVGTFTFVAYGFA